jgi:diguanylate cyclase (GGDEF)-like protein
MRSISRALACLAGRIRLTGLALALAAGLPGAAWAAEPGRSLSAKMADLRAIGEWARGDPERGIAALQAQRQHTTDGSPERLELLTVLGFLLGDQQRDDATAVVQAELEAWAAQRHDPAAAAAALTVAAHLARQSDGLDAAEAQINQALRLSPAPVVSVERFRMQHLLAGIQSERGAFELALASAQETVRIARALHTEADADLLLARALDELAYVLDRAGQSESALPLNDESLRVAERAGNDAERARLLNTRGLIMGSLHRRADAIAAMRQALGLARKAGWAKQTALLLGNLADFHLQAGEYEPARRAAQEALNAAREINDNVSESLALTNLGVAEISLQRLDAGRRHIEQALDIERRKGARREELAILSDAGAAFERAGDAASAIDTYHAQRDLEDSLQQRDHQRAVLDLQEAYDREQRERDLASLTQQGRVHDEALQVQALRQRAWAVGTGIGMLLLSVTGVLLWQHRRDNRAMTSANEQLFEQGHRDPLTGLANRRPVQAAMQEQTGGFAGTAMLVDLDHFKHINDSAGHAAGDAVLVEVARRLRRFVREGDVLTRWGGEEFLILMPALTKAQAGPLAARLLAAIGGVPIDLGSAQRAVQVTASLGFATFAPPGEAVLPLSRVVSLIDAALYQAKAQGRNRAVGIVALHGAGADALDRIERDMAAAAQRGELQLASIAGPAPVHAVTPAADRGAGQVSAAEPRHQQPVAV